MQLIDYGQGPPLVFIPGLHGRWAYSRPTTDALAKHFRVLTASLGDEPSAQAPSDRTRGFDRYGDHVAALMNAAGAPRAVLCGQSFGGLVALNVAARWPERVQALVLA